MAGDACVSLVRGRTIRVTELDRCATPVSDVGAALPHHAVSTGFVSVAFANEVDDGEEINQKNANGDICVLVPPKQIIKWINATVVFCKVDPWIFTKVTSWPLVLNEAGDAIGFRAQRTVENEKGVALEVWTGVKSDSVCPVGLLPTYGYFLLPYLTSGLVTDFTIENAAINFTIVGKGLAGGAWGEGPYDVNLDGLTEDVYALVKLADPIDSEDLWHFQTVILPPPGEQCGQADDAYVGTVTNDAVIDFSVDLTYTAVPNADPNTVDWGDGTTSEGATVIATPTSHVYAGAGTYLITVTAQSGAVTYFVAHPATAA